MDTTRTAGGRYSSTYPMDPICFLKYPDILIPFGTKAQACVRFFGVMFRSSKLGEDEWEWEGGMIYII